MTFRERLADWTDWDAASFYLAVALGILPDEPMWAGRKDLFWSSNPIGDALGDMLAGLVEAGVLERDAEEDKFRWRR